MSTIRQLIGRAHADEIKTQVGRHAQAERASGGQGGQQPQARLLSGGEAPLGAGRRARRRRKRRS